jgi:hypothetical protein
VLLDMGLSIGLVAATATCSTRWATSCSTTR